MKLETMRQLFTLTNHPKSADNKKVVYPRDQIDKVLKILKAEIEAKLEKSRIDKDADKSYYPDPLDFAEDKY